MSLSLRPVAGAPPPEMAQTLGAYRLLALLADGDGGVDGHRSWRALDEATQRQVLVHQLPWPPGLRLAGPGPRTPPLAAVLDQLVAPGLGAAAPAAPAAATAAPPAAAAGADAGLAAARVAVGLRHPVLLPLLAVTRHADSVSLAYEWPGGRSLAQWSAAHGPAPAPEAVRWTAELASALQAVHAQGLVHGRLSPHAVVLGPDGRVRLAELGLGAALLQAAAQAAPPPARDVQALVWVLVALLAGRPVAPDEALDTVLAGVDAALRQLVQQTLRPQPAAPAPDAAGLCAALLAWLLPALSAASGPALFQGTLGLLLQRLCQHSGFPALSGRVLRIQRLAASEADPLQRLADEIQQDVALTQKLLLLVNTAHFKRLGGQVGSVARAVALVGLAGIRNLSLSLVLVEHMHDRLHAQRLKQAFLKALLAAQLAQALADSAQEAEEVYLGALFHRLGELLVECHLPDAAQLVQHKLSHRLGESARAGVSPVQRAAWQEQAACEVLGLGYAMLGTAVARHWGLPDSLQQCMLGGTAAAPVRRLPSGPDRQRWLALACNEIADALWASDDTTQDAALVALVQRHGRALGLGLDSVRRASNHAWAAVLEMAPAMGLAPGQLRAASGADASAAGPAGPFDLVPDDAAALGRLAAGSLAVTDALAGERVQLNAVLHMVLATIHEALACQRVVFCLRDGDGRRLVGRFGLGAGVASVAPQVQLLLRPPAGQVPDLLAQACLNGQDSFLTDARAPAVAAQLPPWLSQGLQPASCLLLPLHLRGALVAVVYADHDRLRACGERERALLGTLRNQALVAFKLAG